MKKIKLLLVLGLAEFMGYAQSPNAGLPDSSPGGVYSGTKPPVVFTPLINTIAGNGTYGFSGDGGQATSAELSDPTATAFDASGNMYIADQGNNRIRKVTTAGVISTIAGTGTAGYSGDGAAATLAKLNQPTGVTFDASGNLYIADQSNNRIRKVNTSGIISTVAGNGTAGYTGDGGQATSAELRSPAGTIFDGSGNMYIADWQNNCIRKVTTAGIISTIAGTGTAGFSGDGGQATAAKLNSPDGIAFDASGNLFIGDEGNNRIRKINTSGVISTISGTTTAGYSGDGGQATAAKLNNPCGVAFDVSGVLYIADRNNNVIRTINTSGVISTLAGNGTAGFSGDCGHSASAELNTAVGVGLDATGNIYISDGANSRIRQLILVCYANAGTNKTNQQDFCGNWTPGVTLGTPALACLSYTWSPSTNLSPTNTATTTSTYSTTMSSQTITYTLTVTGTGCSTSTSTVNVTAVKNTCIGCCREASDIATQNQTTSTFAVYPNPSSGQITISLYNKTEYMKIIDMQGRLLYETKDIDTGEFNIDISKFNKGIYFVMAKIGNTLEKQKLVIE